MFDKVENKWKFDEAHKDIKINLWNYFPDKIISEISYLFSEKNNYLILSTENLIKYINALNQDIISEYQISNLENSNKNTLDIKTVPLSDDLIILCELNKFIYIRFDNDYQTINSIEKIYKDLSIVEWKLLGSLLCFVSLESSKETNKFIICKISVNDNSIEMKDIFEEKIELDSLKSFCVTQNLDYLVFYKANRVLNLYRIVDATCIATVPMFSEIIVLRATSMFIVMAIDDKRIISYLIADPKSSDCSYKIKSLDSR